MTFRDRRRTPRAARAAGPVPGEVPQAPDGTGYSFEYRIPWKTLNAKAPLRAATSWPARCSSTTGAPDGQKTAGGAAWAYDVMREPGFPFQSTRCWGKLIFSPAVLGLAATTLGRERLPKPGDARTPHLRLHRLRHGALPRRAHSCPDRATALPGDAVPDERPVRDVHRADRRRDVARSAGHRVSVR